MKFLIACLLTALFSFATASFFPWWIIAAVAFILAMIIPQKPMLAFLSASTALFFLWGIQAFLIDKKNNHVLAAKVAELLTQRRSYTLIIIITASVGAIVSGFAALTGSLLRQILFYKVNQGDQHKERQES